MVVCSPEVDDEDLPLESETRYGCGFSPHSRQEMCALVMAIPSERLPG